MKEKNSIKNKFSSITKEEKILLKKKLDSSIFSLKRRRVRRQFGVGFSLLFALTLAVGSYTYYNQSYNIENYVQASQSIEVESYNKVKLILNDNSKIEIENDSSTITYSKSGKLVTIGNKDAITLRNQKNNETAYNTIVVPFGRRTKIELSDGTMVWLNSGSKLVYPVVFNTKRREVYLEGEGIFDVAHNKNLPFAVIAKNHEINVLGTVFNVSNYPDEGIISTTLKSGSVEINYKGDSYLSLKESIKINPGLCATYYKNSKQIRFKKVDVNNKFSWRDGLFVFKNDNLEYIMKKLSRYYNVKIIIENKNLTKETFSGPLDLKDDLNEVLKLIKETSKLEYNYTTDKKIIIN